MAQATEEKLLARLNPLVEKALTQYRVIVREEKAAVRKYLDVGTPEIEVGSDTFLRRLYPAREHSDLTPVGEMNVLERVNHFYGNTLSESATYLELHREGHLTARETLEALAKVSEKYPARLSLSSLEDMQQRVRKAAPEEVLGKADVQADIETALQESIDNFGALRKVQDAIMAHLKPSQGEGKTSPWKR